LGAGIGGRIADDRRNREGAGIGGAKDIADDRRNRGFESSIVDGSCLFRGARDAGLVVRFVSELGSLFFIDRQPLAYLILNPYV